ncbi:MAG: hypothetical protein LAT67_06600 [Balneolales bacterium]|nr:hypothetical protein [Balneolales bacterium]
MKSIFNIPSFRVKLSLFIGLIFFLSDARTPAKAQHQQEEQLLEWISTVGKMLYSYHTSYNTAVRLIYQETGNSDIPSTYAAGPVNNGWAFSFGEIDDEGDFIMSYGVMINEAGEVYDFDIFTEYRKASAHHNLAAHALVKVKEDFETLKNAEDNIEAEIFRYAVLPFPRGQLTAFVSPAQYYRNIALVGNDMMYSLNRSNAEILNQTRFIHSLIRLPHQLPENMATLMLRVPQNPMPSPVDVLIAMELNKEILVEAGRGYYMIDPTGSLERLADDNPMVRDLSRQN